MKTDKKISLLRYWTTRYVTTLCIGLLVIAIASVLWIRHTTLEHRLNMLEFLAEEMADRFEISSEGQETPREGLFKADRKLMNIEPKPSIYIIGPTGNILSANPSLYRMRGQVFSQEILENESDVQRLKLDDENGSYFYVVKKKITSNALTLGWVVVVQAEQELTEVNQEYGLLAVMLISLALLGWGAIYFLSRKLSRPIQHVAEAAKEVQEGNYNIQLSEDFREKEVYELVHSFKEMANRLQQLEALRAELLAGVTHELKTPVTSISGLLQAVKDDVVTGEDAKEFLTISLKEVTRMQKMVADLLEFNSFAAHAVPVTNETYDVNELIKEITYQWQMVQEDDSVRIHTELLEKPCYVHVDSMRLQQVFVNLLNNAKQAITGNGTISIRVYELKKGKLGIDVQDTGSGIPAEEQGLIFERFFRGEHKKYKVRGLGLGLPLSKLIAKAIGGDLVLKESSSKGTTFTIALPSVQK